MSEVKPFEISKFAVLEAYKRVKANQGAEGIDKQTIAEFEVDLKDNLYKIWNRMSSGTYFPPPVRTVEIPKADGKKRTLGIPTVGDRIAQTVVKMYLEPYVDPCFHPDSYGYRPNKSAIEAVGKARERCWKYDWVIDLDIKGFFDNMDHELVLEALKKHTSSKWIIMYIERWLKAPAKKDDGIIVQRNVGSPQGGVISPLIANIFMHHAFDVWMKTTHQMNPFERYADDIVIHCVSKSEAESLLEQIRSRLKEYKLDLHPEKTKIVYCKDDERNGEDQNIKFDFLGYTFKMRQAMSRRGNLFRSFLPAISDKAIKKVAEKMKELEIHSRTDRALSEIAELCNPIIRGWMTYYGKFYKSALDEALKCIDDRLIRWAVKKYNKFKGSIKRAVKWLNSIKERNRHLFAHW